MTLRRDFLELSDSNLIEEIHKGNMMAFEFLVTKYESAVASTVKSMLGNTVEADDVGQETFIRFYNSLSSFRGESSIKTYITRIAINLSLNEIKRRKSKRWLQFKDNIRDDSLPSDDGDSRDAKEIVNKALGQLEPNYRSVIVLRLIQSYSTNETAEILKIPMGTVLSRLARGQEKLKQIVLKMEKTKSYG